ncbi:hypothetical protein ACFVWG_39375 [Kribbella sp. NPDC058245]|uniref:hypothetical protein n=1 Tax=Kribbella sp. NPDC058245 TaxID=3346399 RepID=UPI0036EF5F6B
MRKLLRRIALPWLLTALISGTAATVAHADPAYPYRTLCNDFKIGTTLGVKVCLTEQGFDYGAYYEWHATSYFYNLTDHPVTVTSRVDVRSTSHVTYGTTQTETIPVGTYPATNSLWIAYQPTGPNAWSTALITAPDPGLFAYSPHL